MPQSNFQTLLNHVRKQFTDYHFTSGNTFAWSPGTKKITFNTKDPDAQYLLLHELAHAKLGHADYRLDIELLRLESAAWEDAKQFSEDFGVIIDDAYIQDSLDTYRDWLYARSQCPQCKQVGIQPKKNIYSCINCRYSWYVNDAKQCQLRRFRLPARHQAE